MVLKLGEPPSEPLVHERHDRDLPHATMRKLSTRVVGKRPLEVATGQEHTGHSRIG